MLKKLLIGSTFGLLLSAGTLCAEVVVKIGPPAAIVETRPAAPSPNHVWIAGYHNWDGHAYVWVPGRWDVPPRPHARWVAHKWVHRHGGYVLQEGHWR
jgi:hypothetical protein